MKDLNTLNPEQKIKHIENTMNELKELYYSGSLNAIDMGNIFKDLKALYAMILSIEHLNNTPIDPSVKFLINIADKCDNLDVKYIEVSHSNESSGDEDVEVPQSSEKSSDCFKFLKYAIPAHHNGLFD